MPYGGHDVSWTSRRLTDVLRDSGRALSAGQAPQQCRTGRISRLVYSLRLRPLKDGFLSGRPTQICGHAAGTI